MNLTKLSFINQNTQRTNESKEKDLKEMYNTIQRNHLESYKQSQNIPRTKSSGNLPQK